MKLKLLLLIIGLVDAKVYCGGFVNFNDKLSVFNRKKNLQFSSINSVGMSMQTMNKYQCRQNHSNASSQRILSINHADVSRVARKKKIRH